MLHKLICDYWDDDPTRMILLKSEKTGNFHCVDLDYKAKKIRMEGEKYDVYLSFISWI